MDFTHQRSRPTILTKSNREPDGKSMPIRRRKYLINGSHRRFDIQRLVLLECDRRSNGRPSLMMLMMLMLMMRNGANDAGRRRRQISRRRSPTSRLFLELSEPTAHGEFLLAGKGRMNERERQELTTIVVVLMTCRGEGVSGRIAAAAVDDSAAGLAGDSASQSRGDGKEFEVRLTGFDVARLKEE